MKELTLDEHKELERIRHDNRMAELAYVRETEKIKHQYELERQRIKSAEIRKAQQARWVQDRYPKGVNQ